jgi:transketolase
MTEDSNIDVRDAFFDEIYRIASRDRNLVVLTDDQGAFSLDRFRNDLKGQYLNMGIAEQNIISVAAGLALGGKIPFVYGISTFITMRCFEQIRDDLSCMNLPVTIIGSGPGYSYGSDGPTHHATQDVAILRTLPHLTILNPADAVASSACVQMGYKALGPTYIRIERGVLPILYDDHHSFSAGFAQIRMGRDLLIISTGIMVHKALEVSDRLSEIGIGAGVLDLYRLKPVHEPSLLSSLQGVERIVTLEENSIVGGLGSLVAEILADHKRMIALKRIALPDRHCYEYGNRDWQHSYEGLDVAGIVRVIEGWK